MTAASLQLDNRAYAESGGSDAFRWSQIARRRVYFGHQSVGSDVLGGVRHWNEKLDLGVRLVQTRQPSSVAGPALIHFLAGQNGDFASKNTAILRYLGSRDYADDAIVLLKYCYVDINDRTDVDGQFDEYRDTIATIAVDHPDVTVVHTTIPITTLVEGPLKARAKRFMGRDTLRGAAIARHRYNTLVRAEFAGQPLFDIARAEATRHDGTHAQFLTGGRPIETLASEHTTDGGHLNASGQRAVARGFLDAIAEAIDVVGTARPTATPETS